MVQITQPNWEAMEVALGRLRVECMLGKCYHAQSEIIYLLTNLGALHQEIRRCTEGSTATPE